MVKCFSTMQAPSATAARRDAYTQGVIAVANGDVERPPQGFDVPEVHHFRRRWVNRQAMQQRDRPGAPLPENIQCSLDLPQRRHASREQYGFSRAANIFQERQMGDIHRGDLIGGHRQRLQQIHFGRRETAREKNDAPAPAVVRDGSVLVRRELIALCRLLKA